MMPREHTREITRAGRLLNRPVCAGKPDGSPCHAPAKGGTPYCRHHQRETKSAPASPSHAQIREWVLMFVDELARLATASGQDVPELRGEFNEDVALAIGERKVPTGILIGLSAHRLGMLFSNGAHVALSLTGPEEEERENAASVDYLVTEGELRVRISGRAWLAADGLPDLRMLSFPPSEWPKLQRQKAAGLTLPPISPEVVAHAANGRANQELQRALIQPDGWQTNPHDVTKYYTGNEITFIYQAHEHTAAELFEQTVRQDALRALDLRFCQMNGDLVADVCDILLLHWYAANKPDKLGITLSQVLEYRDVDPQKKTMAEHWQALRDARAIRLRGGMLEDIALFEIDTLRPRQPNLFGLDCPPEADRIYLYSVGGVMRLALKQEQAFFAPYARKILELHPYNHNIAKRLARYLRSDWRLNPEGYVWQEITAGKSLLTQPRYRTWRAHLADAGIEISERCRKKPAEFFESLDDQLLELCRVGALADWVPGLSRGQGTHSNWDQAARLYHPSDRRRLAHLPYHGKLEAFLALRVHLPPPADVANVLAEHLPGRRGRLSQKQALAQEVAVRKALRDPR